jgi:hypothetical protein
MRAICPTHLILHDLITLTIFILILIVRYWCWSHDIDVLHYNVTKYYKLYPVPKHHAIKSFSCVDIKVHAFRNSTLNGVERPASCYGHLHLGKVAN